LAAGVNVHIAEGDADAERSLADHRFELVVIGDTGTVFEIYRATTETFRSVHALHAPVILLINPEDRTEAITTIETGPDDFLILPLNAGVFVSRVARTV